MPGRSIRSRLLVAQSCCALVVIVAGVWLTYALVREHMEREFDRFLADKLLYQQISAVQIGDRVSFRISQPVWERIHDPADPEFFQFRFLDGRDLYRSYGLGDEGELPKVGLRGGAGTGIDIRLPNGKPGRCMGTVFEPELGEGAAEPVRLHLVVARDRTELDRALSRLRWLLLAAGVAASALVLAATLWIIRRALRPVADLSEQIAAMPVGGAGERFELADAPLEVQPVVERLNALLGRVEGALEHERQFTSNAAHELRNPLAALRSQLELALSAGRDPEADADTFVAALEIQRQMEGRVGNLLALARLDSGQEEVERGSIDPAQALRRCWKPFFERAAEHGLRVRWDLDRCPDRFDTAPALFEILASNLFDNATSYTPESGVVEIAAHGNGAGLCLEVANCNPGVEAAGVAELAHRFRRGDPSSAGGEEHFGIGLSICDKVVATLGGQIAFSVDPERFRVRVELPAA